MKCLLIHDWYHGDYMTGYRSKFTGDHIGRSERRCMDCGKRQLSVTQFGIERQKILKERFNIPKNAQYATYEVGDELDNLTIQWLVENTSTKPFKVRRKTVELV